MDAVPSPDRPPSTRPSALAGVRGLVVALLLGLGLVRVGAVRGGDEGAKGSSACGVPCFRDDDDEGLRLAYDGLRRGLEEANLQRVCLRRPATDDAAGWERLAREISAEKPPFVVALGRRVSARVATLPLTGPDGRIPCVYVDVASGVGGRAMPLLPAYPAPAAVVRSEVAVESWGALLKALLPGRPQLTVLLPWTSESKEAAALRREAGRGGGFDARLLSDGPATPDAILAWSPSVGETVEPFAATLERARSLRVPLLCVDAGLFLKGAAVALLPDAALLGRVAADAARRLAEGERAPERLRIATTATELCVDLDAADAEGLAAPLAFLASAHRLRRSPRSPAPVPTEAPKPPAGGDR